MCARDRQSMLGILSIVDFFRDVYIQEEISSTEDLLPHPKKGQMINSDIFWCDLTDLYSIKDKITIQHC